MKAYFESYGCAMNAGESREIPALGAFYNIQVLDATPTYLIGTRGR